MLVAENLTKDYKDITAVNNVSFKVESGRIFGLLGPNGAGKTTIIRTILNIIKPTSGRILFDGEPINDQFFNIIGYLPEERGLYKKSKTIDIILYFARLKNMNKKSALSEADRWLKKLDITVYRNKKIEELSKGNQQKVQFITAIIHNPGLIVLDEPFAGFDPINQQLIKEIIISLSGLGKTIILSTHQMDTAEKLCSDIFLINKGKEVCSGSMIDIKKRFGTNTIRIIFEGDGSFLTSLPYVIRTEQSNSLSETDTTISSIEVTLKEEIQPKDFLKDIMNRVSVTHFSVVEPALDKIFIDVIRNSQ
jgi:ABC-2 type transport system ATP-binding protein